MSNEALALQYKAGNEAALMPLWDQVHGLAYTIASSYQELLQKTAAVDLDDLLQAAFLGVEAAARSYDPDRARFSTYATLHIKRQCRAALGLSGSRRPELVSLDAPLDEDATLHDLLSDPEAAPVDAALLADDLARKVQSAVSSLPQAQAEAVSRHWLAGESYQQIMEAMGVTRSALQRLIRIGLQQLSRRRSLRDLAEAYCYRHVSLAAFKTSNTSATERAALRLLEEGFRADKRRVRLMQSLSTGSD